MTRFRASAKPTRTWKHFDLEVDDLGVATLTFTRPDKLNAITFDVYADLRDLTAELPNRREEVKVLVLRGRGKGFCSGGDVHEIIGPLLGMDPTTRLEFTRMTCQVVQNLREMPQPVIAQVHGVAAGAGSVLALASDFRLLGESGSFAFLFTKVGLSGGDMGSAYLLPRLVGFARATELLMLGDRIDARRAYEVGLCNAVHSDDELEVAVRALADRLATGPVEAYANTKRLLSRELDLDLHGALELEAMTQAHLMSSEDFAEFHRAFTAREKPRWKGR
ncbi:MAG: enoyl-CoA hydratase family protein [Planctomycetota bacterium]